MKVWAVMLVVVSVLVSSSMAEILKMKGFLVPASAECYVTVSFDGSVIELNVMGNGKIEYDDTGRIKKIGNTKISYDDTGRIEEIGTSGFKYDDAGRIKKIATATITYDETNRIKQVGVSKITYDDDGRVDGINPGISASI